MQANADVDSDSFTLTCAVVVFTCSGKYFLDHPAELGQVLFTVAWRIVFFPTVSRLPNDIVKLYKTNLH